MLNGLVILNYNDSERVINLANTLDSYNFFKVIVVVDNNSSETEKEKLKMIKSENIKTIYAEKNKGYGAGHNIGFNYLFENYKLDTIFAINSDVIVEKKTLELCANKIVENKKLALVSPIMLDRFKKVDKLTCWKYPTVKESMQYCFFLGRRGKFMTSQLVNDYKKYELLYCDVIRGSLQCFDANYLKQSKMFDENVFLYNEENIISKRIKKVGGEIAVLTSCEYIHNHTTNSFFNTKKFKASLDSMYYFMSAYCNIGKFKKTMLKICMMLGTFEHRFIDLYFKLSRKGE